MNWQKELDLAVQTAHKVGQILNDFERSQVNSDAGRDIKHKADIAAHEQILSNLTENSAYPVLSEESFKEKDAQFGGLYWIVDPLDGTVNYTRDMGNCCVSIGLWQDNEPVLGVVYDFEKGRLFKGVVGQGCWFNEAQAYPSLEVKAEKAILATGFPVNRDFESASLRSFLDKIIDFKKIRLLGSAALSLAYVATGRVDAYTEEDIMLWDVAAGLALVKAAGGYVDYTWSKRKQLALTVKAGQVFAASEAISR